MVTIDGAHGEGGGQIVRSALALSLVTGTAFRIERVRAGRDKPGLRRQHLAAVHAAAAIGDAVVDGVYLGSGRLEFHPRRVQPGAWTFAVGTAGSATLVLQTVLPAVLRAAAPSVLTVHGGTHNRGAPPFDFLARTFLPLLARLGPTLRAELGRYGFYPAGGGRITVTVEPSRVLAPLALLQRGPILRRRGRAVVSDLPVTIAERELAVVCASLGWNEDEGEVVSLRSPEQSGGPGNAVMLEIDSGAVCEVATGFGARGVRAETVASTAVAEATAYLASGVPVGEHLADQLLLPLALAGGGAFRTMPLTRHSTTNMHVIRHFLDVRFAVTTWSAGEVTVEVTAPR
jgi:RNA 3'-terminal phosphate cyclase (ATP)